MAVPIRIRQPAPIRGLTTSQPADTLDATQSPRALNVRFRFGEVRQAPGRDIVAGPVENADALHIGRFALVDGQTEWSVLLTETGWFRWGAGTPGTPQSWSRVNGSGLTGTTRYTVAAGEDYLFAARMSHPIKRWNGDDASSFESIPDGGTFAGAGVPQARHIEYFNNRLLLGWTIEDGNDFANRLRWPVNGDHTDWSGAGAGFLDLYEGNAEPITGVKGLGGRCAIYQPHAIVDLIPTGTTDPVFITETRVRGRGTRAPYTIASTGLIHFFLGEDANVYAWDGTNLQAIGDPILSELQGLVYPDQMASYFGVVSTLRQEYWLVLGNGDVFVYDYARDAWSRDSFPNITALGEVTDTQSNETWTTVTTTWDAETRTWAEMGGTSSTVLWAGRSDGGTFAVDETVNYDYYAEGSIMDRYCETPDWYPPTPESPNGDPYQLYNLQDLMLMYQYVTDDQFEVGVSIDRGATWQTQMVTPSTSGVTKTSWNITGQVFRFRFRERDVDGAFRWRSYSYQFVPGGQYLAA